MSVGREAWWRERGWLLGVWAVLAVAVFFRLYALGRLPGINGDEAWYGVQVQHFLEGATPQWRTPTGNLPGPLHLGVLLLLQKVFPPSFVLLRVPSVLSSLGALGLTYAVVRRHFDRPTGTLALVLMAVLPVNIAYARFGWDPSHSMLVGMGAAYFALAGQPVGCALVFALALAVHPTNVFLAPFLVLTFLGTELERGGYTRALVRTAVQVVLLVLALGVLRFTTSGGQATVNVPEALQRLRHLSQWGTFAQLYARLLTGDTVYLYIAGSGLGAARDVADIAVGLVLGGLLTVGAVRLRRERLGREVGVVLGWAVSLFVFFVLAGHDAIKPHLERYALCLVVPTVLALAVLLRELGARGAHLERPCLLTAVLAVLLLGGFWLRYFSALETQGSTSHQTFWTGAREPKQVAFERILAEASPRGGARVVAENWWVFWPLTYLAAGTPLTILSERQGPGMPPPGGTYWVAFPDGPLDQWLSRTRVALPRWDIPGAARPVSLRVWWTPSPGAAPPPP